MTMFFLMCSERSGSNFVTKLLNGHSNICGPSTKHIINPVARNLFRYEPLGEEDNWNALLADIHNLMSVSFTMWKREFSLDDLMGLAPTGDIQALLRNIFHEEAKANGKQHVFIKENHLYEFLPFLLLNFPEARYIYQSRDPRDMALSWKKNPDHPGGVVSAARRWQQDQQNFLKNYNELEKIGKAYHLRYEDLISEPQRYSAEMLNFLGLPVEDVASEFYKDELTRKNADLHQAWSNLSRTVISDNKEKYLKELTAEEIGVIEKICYYEMCLLGYTPTRTSTELNSIDEKMIGRLDAHERESIKYERSDGVKSNMNAKRRFYTRLGVEK